MIPKQIPLCNPAMSGSRRRKDRRASPSRRWDCAGVLAACVLGCFLSSPLWVAGQPRPGVVAASQEVDTSPAGRRSLPLASEWETTQEWNRRLGELVRSREAVPVTASGEYRIGPEDLLDITVFEAAELNRSVRVSASGEITLPLLGVVRAAGLTPRELELVCQELLRRTYMKDPHVSVFVREMESHPVSVFGAVEKPGVFQIRGTKTLLEILSLAEGLADDAGDTVIVMRGSSFPGARPENGASGKESIEIDLKELLETGASHYNVPIYPGDIVKVTRAGIVYVVGEVRKPGGFVLKSNEKVSVLQAVAMAEGLTRTSAKGQARIIRTDETTGDRREIPLDLGKILAGKAPDPLLEPNDIVFVPNSAARSAFMRGLEVTLQTVSGVLIFRR